jgi:hypothetical protein
VTAKSQSRVGETWMQNAPSPVRLVTADDPASMARSLVEFWYARWSGCERLSDVSVEFSCLHPWTDHLAKFELLNHGADFRARSLGLKLIEFFGHDWSGTKLSEMSSPYRQNIRRMLLRSAMIRQPATEHFEWLVNDHALSCIVCALPIAGGYFQPTQLLLGIFWRTSRLIWNNNGPRPPGPQRNLVTTPLSIRIPRLPSPSET